MIETHMGTSQEKLVWWGDGPWVTEPDMVEFTHLGFPCKVHRKMNMGHLCGYIKLPENHPWCSLDPYEDSIPIDIHGGVTYNETDLFDGRWIGFDCMHSHDLSPFLSENSEYEKIRRAFKIQYPKSRVFDRTYRTVAFCIGECKSLAEQALKAASQAQP